MKPPTPTQYRHQANTLINTLYPTLPPQAQQLIDVPLSGGELGYALQDLHATIHQHPHLATPHQHQQIHHLLNHTKHKPHTHHLTIQYQTPLTTHQTQQLTKHLFTITPTTISIHTITPNTENTMRAIQALLDVLDITPTKWVITPL